jgi:hypothetical protein
MLRLALLIATESPSVGTSSPNVGKLSVDLGKQRDFRGLCMHPSRQGVGSQHGANRATSCCPSPWNFPALFHQISRSRAARVLLTFIPTRIARCRTSCRSMPARRAALGLSMRALRPASRPGGRGRVSGRGAMKFEGRHASRGPKKIWVYGEVTRAIALTTRWSHNKTLPA